MSSRRGNREEKEPEGRLSDKNLAIAAFILIAVGFAMIATGFANSESVDYVLNREKGTYVPAHDPFPWWELVRNLGFSSVSVGTLGIVFEVYNRRAWQAAVDRAFEKSAERLGKRVAGDTLELVIGNRRFVNEVLDEDRRQRIVTNLIMAHLEDPTAEILAKATATQLSGPVRLRQYEATYFARDKAVRGGKPDPHATLWQSVITDVRPSSIFKYRFEVLRDEDTDKFGYGPDVFVWRYWLAPDEDPEVVLKQFEIVKVSVNDVPLTNIRKNISDAMSVSFLADYQSVEEETEYEIETELRLPAPKEASYFHISPRGLCREVRVTCNVMDSEFDAVAVETLGGAHIRKVKMPSDRRRTIATTLSTTTWVLPTASVAFVFYKPTQPYNKPGKQRV